MKLTIVFPSIGKRTHRRYIKSWLMEPLAPAYLAALTPKDIEIDFWDDRIEDVPFDRPTDLVAINLEAYSAKRAYQIASEYHRRGVSVIAGGVHATLVPDEVLRYVDSVVIGRAENIFAQLLNDFRRGVLKRRYREDSNTSIPDILPDRAIFKGKRYLKIGLVETSIGCPMNCDFCSIASFYGSKYKRRSEDIVLEEIKRLSGEKKLFFFVDDNVCADISAAKSFLKKLIPLKIKWVSQASISIANDEELLRLIKDSGCQGLLVGIESLKQSNLNLMNKSFIESKSNVEKALRKIKKYAIRIYATFIFGYDHDDVELMNETFEFCMRHKLFITAFNHLMPFPGTPLYERLELENRFIYGNWHMDDNYRFGKLPFRSSLSPDIVSQKCLELKHKYFSYRSIAKRFLAKENLASLYSAYTFLLANFIFRKEISQRQGYKLGNDDFKGELEIVNNGINDARR